MLSKSNNRERDIKLESEELRKCLIQLYTSVRRLLENQMNRFDNTNNSNQYRDSYAETARFRLPMNCGGKEAIEMVEDLLARLKEEWNYQIENNTNNEEITERDKTIELLKQSIEDLLETNDQLKIEHEESLKMYKKFEQGGFFDTLYPTPKDAYMSDSEDSVVDLEYRSLRKKALRDQRKITESAIELGQQRAALKVKYNIYMYLCFN